MTINEEYYNSILEDLAFSLEQEIETNTIKIKTHQYKDYFTKNGNWDKRRRYFNIEISIYNKGNNPILEIGRAISKVGQFIEKSNSEKVYMVGQLITSAYNSTVTVSINFISYDLAAKILLSQ